VQNSLSDLDLPFAKAWVDHTFITVLAAPNRAAAVGFYRDQIGFEEGATYTLTYTVLNEAFGFDESVKTDITMTKVGKLPGLEIDQYPAAATPRPTAPGELAPGVAMVSYVVESLERVTAPFLCPPSARSGPLYQGRRAATLIGPAGERLELIERT
jgi:hypothetical protein